MMFCLSLIHHSALLLIVAALAAVPLTNASIVATDLLWLTKDQYGIVKIRVCVDNGSSADQRSSSCYGCIHEPNPSLDDVVRNVRYALFKGWEQHTSIRFYDWRKCNDLTASQQAEAMQLYIHPNADNAAKLGILSQGAYRGVHFKPWGASFNECIYYNGWTTHMTYTFDCAQQYAVHEFGHALGLDHEWQHPLTTDGCRAFVDGYAPNEVKYDPLPFDMIVNPNYYDWDSIMTYDNACAQVTGVRFGSPWPTLTDTAGLVQSYPKAKVSDIRLVDWVNAYCMDIDHLGTRNLFMIPCTFGSDQLFSYNWTDSTIKSPALSGWCLDGTTNRNAYVIMSPCNGGANQKWLYYRSSGAIVNQYSYQCLDLNAGNSYLELWDCHGGWNQKFSQPADDVFEIRSASGSYSRCWEIQPNTLMLFYDTECSGWSSQKFRYDKVTKRITSPYLPSTVCLGLNASYYLKMASCNNGANQKWNYNVTTGYLTNDLDLKRCAAVGGDNSIYMRYRCYEGDNVKFVFFGYRP